MMDFLILIPMLVNVCVRESGEKKFSCLVMILAFRGEEGEREWGEFVALQALERKRMIDIGRCDNSLVLVD